VLELLTVWVQSGDAQIVYQQLPWFVHLCADEYRQVKFFGRFQGGIHALNEILGTSGIRDVPVAVGDQDHGNDATGYKVSQ